MRCDLSSRPDPAESVLWLDRRTWGRRSFDALWQLYRRFNSSLAAVWFRAEPRVLATQEMPGDERAAAYVAQSLADSWFEGLGLEYGGIDLGPLLRYKLGGYNVHLHGLCRQAYKVQALLEAYHPSRVFMAEPALLPAGAFLEALGPQRGVRVSALLPGPIRRLGRALVNRFFYTIGYEKTEVPLFQARPHLPLAPLDAPTSMLFVASMGNYVNPMLPVMPALSSQVVTVVPSASREWKRYADLVKVSRVVFAEQLLDPALATEMQAKRREYRLLFREKRALCQERLRLENGLDLWPFAALGMQVVFDQLLPHAVGYIGLAERAIRHFRPRAVVIARQRRIFENAFVAVARRHGIPTGMLIHGHVSSQPVYHFVDGRFDQVDLICSWGEAQKQALLEKGAPGDGVLVTGNPQWDRLSTSLGNLAPRDVCRSTIVDQVHVPEETFWVTFTSQAVSRSFFPTILDVIRRLPGTVLIVKVHPGERVKDYQAMVPPSDRRRCWVVKAVDLHTLLQASDVVLTFTSTTNLEALAVGTPLCIVDFSGEPDMPQRIDLSVYGIPEARDDEQLCKVLTDMRQDPAWCENILAGGRRALEDYAHGLDGRATERVVRALLELAQEDLHISGASPR
jgi:hypothetical protein